ncbi:MAG: MBL fold metallo-hydrolase [Ignavibacteriales bacterium]|nr:MBL fold metallo-hydrolase [Ignavibacteriales bacterium]
MKLQFLGAAQTVTGSMHLLTVNGSRILLDCGLFQGRRAEAFERNKNFPFDPADIDAVVLSHAHIDHAGNLPNLVRSGFKGPIYATSATRDLSNVMLFDSAYLQERDVEFVNKQHKKRNEPLIEPLYTSDDVEQTVDQMVSMRYGQNFEVADGVSVSFADAGHVLGSAVTRIEAKEGGRTKVIGFSGDLGRRNMPILKDPESIGDVDVWISESTYGGRIHEPIVGMEHRLMEVIQRTLDRRGKLIVPAFSVGKTQEFLYVLFTLNDAGKLPSIPIFVDSPLSVHTTEVFKMHPECFDKETMQHIVQKEDPFGFGRLKFVRSVEESKKLNDIDEPCMIIASSGMCEGGRILHHLANNISDPKNTILVVGFMAEHTLGRRIVERQPQVRIYGELHSLKAEVAILNSFSAHAGQDELVGYAKTMEKSRVKQTFIVHGELAQAQQLSQQLSGAGYGNIAIPARGDSVEIVA